MQAGAVEQRGGSVTRAEGREREREKEEERGRGVKGTRRSHSTAMNESTRLYQGNHSRHMLCSATVYHS